MTAPAPQAASLPDTVRPAHRPLPVLSGGPDPDAQSGADGGPVVACISLGCPKNLVDTERMLAELAESGATLSADVRWADTVVVNTCGFLQAARREALRVLRDLAARKRRGELRRLVVTGCLVQRYGPALRRQVPEIDALLGVNNRADIVRAVRGPDAPGGVAAWLDGWHGQAWSDQVRLRLTPRHYAWLRISEGCSQKCTFCTIPSIRGPLHSKTPAQIEAEARELVADGAQELVLIGQDTTSYGQDIGYAPGLAGLLRRLDRAADGARWIRLMYVYPSVLSDAILDAIAECPRVVKYIDVPLQHISDRILRAMHRRITRAQTEALLERIRRRIPGVALRTTFIVGFPGETDAEFDELLEFVRHAGFDAVGAFVYSPEPGTPAFRLPGRVPAAEARRRYRALCAAARQVAERRAAQRIGRRFEVLVDRVTRRGAVARHAGQAPEVDTVCRLSGARVAPGTFVEVVCTGTRGADLCVRPAAGAAPGGCETSAGAAQ